MSKEARIQKAAREMAKAGASKGGVARAESLTPEQRSDIARRAVLTRWTRAGLSSDTPLPKATHAGELIIGNTVIPCAVLENGTRVLTQAGFLRAIGRSGNPPGPAKGKAGFEKVPAFLRGKGIMPFIDADLVASSTPIFFQPISGAKAFGYKAELLPRVCEVYLRARDENTLLPSQAQFAVACDALMRGLAHVGITALVDEATGYQADRARDALERILAAFIAKEYQKWLKTFPDDFYREMFRLRNWSYNPFSVKRPHLVGRYTNDLVYERLAPGVLEELKKVNPRTQSGYRRHKYFQWLTTDIGHPRLREHLTAVVALMKASDNWTSFKRAMNRALPKPQSQIELTGPGFDDRLGESK